MEQHQRLCGQHARQYTPVLMYRCSYIFTLLPAVDPLAILNAPQRKAVTVWPAAARGQGRGRPDRSLVVAGAGTGKTNTSRTGGMGWS